MRRRTGEPRQRAGLRRAHVVDRQQRRDRLGVGEAAERVEAGDAERLGQPPARDQRRRRRDVGRAPVRPFAERQSPPAPGSPPVRAGRAGRAARAAPSAAVSNSTGGDVEPGGADAVAGPAPAPSSRLARAGFQQRFLGDRAGGDEAHHLAADRRLAGARLRVLHLLGHRDAEAAADQAGRYASAACCGTPHIGIGAAVVLAALGQRDVERGGGGLGVGEEQLVEIAHAEEHQRVRMRLLGGEPLRHGGRGAGRHRGGVAGA